MKVSFDPYRNKHKGERCFILGNGPSLAEENLSLLKDEIVFIVNRGYFALDLGLDHYDYYVLTDLRVYSEDASEIQTNVTSPRFYSSLISDNSSYLSGPQEDYIPINRPTDKKDRMGLFRNNFPINFEDGWGKARTVVFDTVLVAYFMGFKEIYFLGVDLSNNTDNTNTHFYGTGDREQKLKREFEGKPDGFKKLVENFNLFFKNNNVTFINLSKGFSNKVPLKTDRLENVLANKLYT